MVYLKVNVNIVYGSIEASVQITSETLDDQIFCAMYFSMLLCNICTFLYHLDVTLWNGVVLEQVKQNLAVLSDICCSNYTQRKQSFAVGSGRRARILFSTKLYQNRGVFMPRELRLNVLRRL